MNSADTLFYIVMGGIAFLPLMLLLGIVIEVIILALRSWAYRRVSMLGSSTRGQFRSGLYKMFGHTCAIDAGKFGVITDAHDVVFFLKVTNGGQVVLPTMPDSFTRTFLQRPAYSSSSTTHHVFLTDTFPT